MGYMLSIQAISTPTEFHCQADKHLSYMYRLAISKSTFHKLCNYTGCVVGILALVGPRPRERVRVSGIHALQCQW